MESAAPGRLVDGRYRLAAVVGRGGMGVVWRARDERLSRDVAVKELVRPAGRTPQETRAACRRAVGEARAAARLNHPNVIRVFDIIEEDGWPWIVMELLSPWSLWHVLRERGPVSPARAAEIGLGVLAGLRAAHAAGIVHRDVKPSNILLAPDRVVLADFGIAQAAGSPALNEDGALVGSPSYVAPERACGAECGPAADLWGLGAALYAAVEGHGPFDRDDDPRASLTAVVADEPAPAAAAGPLWPVISGLLRKDPGQRLDAAETERLLRQAAIAARTVIPRPRSADPAAPAILAAPALPATVAESCPPAGTPPRTPLRRPSWLAGTAGACRGSSRTGCTRGPRRGGRLAGRRFYRE